MGYLIVIRGPLGSGKTTIAQRVAEAIQADIVAIDRIVDENGLSSDKEAGYISQRSFLKANTIALPKILTSLQAGKSVVVDGNFYWQSQIDDLLQKVACPSMVFTLKAPLAVCIDRDSKRKNPHGKDAAAAVYKKSTELTSGIEIDVTKSVDESVDTILKHVPPSPTQKTTGQ